MGIAAVAEHMEEEARVGEGIGQGRVVNAEILCRRGSLRHHAKDQRAKGEQRKGQHDG